MKNLLFTLCLLITFVSLGAQNVGIGTTSPAEKLDVAGNIKTSGEIKPNGVAGQAGQVLTSNGNGTMQWTAATNTPSTYSNVGGFGPWGGCEIQNITDMYPSGAAQGITSSDYGYAVDISGDYAIVSATGENHPPSEATGAGAAYILKRNTGNGEWEVQAKFFDTSIESSEFWGYTVAISGNYAAVGNHREDTLGFANTGAVSIFKRNAATGQWAFHSKIYNNNNGVSYNFGWSIAMDGDYLIVGIPNEKINGVTAGAANIYKRNAATDVWELQQKVIHPNYASSDKFGWAVDIDGDHAIVGAPFDDIGAVDNGSAHIYKRNASNIWVVLPTLYNGASDGDNFGFTVDMSTANKTVAVGAIADDIAGTVDAGTVTVYYENPAGLWLAATTLYIPTNTSANAFGISIDLDDNYLMIGDHQNDTSKGKVYIYKKIGNLYMLIEEFVNPFSVATNEYFGGALSLDGSTKRFIIGCSNMSDSGMVFFGKIN